MTGPRGRRVELTKSFRFEPAIADVANRRLRHAGSDLRLTGVGPRDSRVTRARSLDAVVCRATPMDLVDSYSEDTIIYAMDRLSKEEDVRVTVSTAYKAKGREWGTAPTGGEMAGGVSLIDLPLTG